MPAAPDSSEGGIDHETDQQSEAGRGQRRQRRMLTDPAAGDGTDDQQVDRPTGCGQQRQRTEDAAPDPAGARDQTDSDPAARHEPTGQHRRRHPMVEGDRVDDDEDEDQRQEQRRTRGMEDQLAESIHASSPASIRVVRDGARCRTGCGVSPSNATDCGEICAGQSQQQLPS